MSLFVLDSAGSSVQSTTLKLFHLTSFSSKAVTRISVYRVRVSTRCGCRTVLLLFAICFQRTPEDTELPKTISVCFSAAQPINTERREVTSLSFSQVHLRVTHSSSQDMLLIRNAKANKLGVIEDVIDFFLSFFTVLLQTEGSGINRRSECAGSM